MHRARLARVFGVLLLMALYGCSGGGGGGDDTGGTQSGDGGQQAANTAFNGTFGGTFAAVQGGQTFQQAVTMTLAVGSPLSGIFTADTGASGTISGEAIGNSATFTGSFGGGCPGTLSGSLTLIDENTLSFEASGTDCNGAFTDTGTVMRLDVNTLAGTWQGRWESDLFIDEGTLTVTFSQTESSFTGTVSLTGSPCFTAGQLSGTIVNDSITIGAVFGSEQTSDFAGLLNADASAMEGIYEVTTGPCAGDVGGWTGSFTRAGK